MPLDPYAARIRQQRQRIQDHSGDDSQLRDRLNQLRRKRAQGNPQREQQRPMPWNAAYESQVGLLDQNLGMANAGYDAQEQMLQKQFGFNDSSDPFSVANQLQQQFAAANRGTGNNYAAAGQLYAGSLNNARAIDRRNFDTAWDSAQKNLASQLFELQQQRLGSQQDYGQGVLDAEADRLEAALQERTDPAEAPGRGRPNRNNRRRRGR